MGEAVDAPLARRLSAKRSEMAMAELESTALRLFAEHGFDNVPVSLIAAEAQISVRTFYRYFPSREDVLQHRIVRRGEGLRDALAARPADEPPLQALRVAFAEQVAAEDVEIVQRWTAVVATTPGVVKAVLGGIQLNTQQVIAQFLAARLDQASDALVPTMIAAAAQGIIQAVQAQWYVHGGDLASMISDGLEVLETGLGGGPTTALS